MLVESALGLLLLCSPALSAPSTPQAIPKLNKPSMQSPAITFQRGNVAVGLKWYDTSNDEVWWEIQRCTGFKCTNFNWNNVFASTTTKTVGSKISKTIHFPLADYYGFRVRACSKPGSFCGQWSTVVNPKCKP